MLDIFATIGLTIALARLVMIDLRSFRLPDVWTLPLIGAGLGLAALAGPFALLSSALGGAVGYAVFWGIGLLYHRRTGIEGLGLGDAKLFAASGTWLGLALLPHVLLIAAVGGLIFALATQRSARQGIAFGPWLALGFWVMWIASRTGWVG